MEPVKPLFMMYLAGPMDDVSTEEASGWRDKVIAEFPDIVFFRPDLAYGNATADTAPAILHMNQHGIECSQALIANLSGPGRGFGTIREIEYARTKTRYVAIAADRKDIGPHTLMAHDCHLFDTPTEAVQAAWEFLTDKINEPPMFMGLRLDRGFMRFDEEERPGE